MLKLTTDEKRARFVIKTTKKELLAVNDKLNEELKKLRESELSYDLERAKLLRVRDKNIETIQEITELELKGVI